MPSLASIIQPFFYSQLQTRIKSFPYRSVFWLFLRSQLKSNIRIHYIASADYMFIILHLECLVKQILQGVSHEKVRFMGQRQC